MCFRLCFDMELRGESRWAQRATLHGCTNRRPYHLVNKPKRFASSNPGIIKYALRWVLPFYICTPVFPAWDRLHPMPVPPSLARRAAALWPAPVPQDALAKGQSPDDFITIFTAITARSPVDAKGNITFAWKAWKVSLTAASPSPHGKRRRETGARQAELWNSNPRVVSMGIDLGAGRQYLAGMINHVLHREYE